MPHGDLAEIRRELLGGDDAVQERDGVGFAFEFEVCLGALPVEGEVVFGLLGELRAVFLGGLEEDLIFMELVFAEEEDSADLGDGGRGGEFGGEFAAEVDGEGVFAQVVVGDEGGVIPLFLSSMASSVTCGTDRPISISLSAFENTSLGLPFKTTLPLSITKTLSACMTSSI